MNRFRVPEAQTAEFQLQARAAIEVLSNREGFVSVDFGRNIDEPELWTISTRWINVGSYRRALNGFESKMVVVPLLSLAIDEPSAYEDPEHVGPNLSRGAGPR
nr:antibiotic biosynthesis monooxygenase family protein [Microlunatus panaciterrae]